MNREAANVEMVEEARNLAGNVLTENRSEGKAWPFSVACASQ
jgi:hypothetical protein